MLFCIFLIKLMHFFKKSEFFWNFLSKLGWIKVEIFSALL